MVEPKNGMEVVGRIVRVKPWGASVDIGAKKKAFLPVTEMISEPKEFISGQIVKCRVNQVESALRVTCKEDDGYLFPLESFETGQKVPGVVTSVTPQGAFVDIGAKNAAVLRTSDIIKGRNIDLTKALQVGDHIECYISEIDTRKDRARVAGGVYGSKSTRIWRPGHKGSLRIKKRRGRWGI